MIVRQAMFQGRVKDGQWDEMRAYATNTLMPLWQKFDCAKEVRVYFSRENDPDGPEFPLTLAITYDDDAGMAQGLASDARYASRDLLPAFYAQFFDHVTLLHYVMDLETADQ